MSGENGMSAADQVGERTQLFGWWCGIAFFVLFFVGTGPMMGFIPPPGPGVTGAQLIAKIGPDINMVRFGIVVAEVAAFLLIPWSAVVAVQISRLEGRIPFIAMTAFGAGVANAVVFFIPYMFWAGAFFRLDRDPNLVTLINDITWLEWIMAIQPTAFQVACIGAAGLLYKGPRQIFPRWFSFMNLWVALLFCPGMLAIFFLSGPFAWNGILCWWLPVVAFVVYFPISLVIIRRAIKSHKYD